MDALAIALILAGSLDPDHGDRAHVAPFVLLQRAGIGIDLIEFIFGEAQRFGPLRVGQGGYLHGQLDHFLALQIGPADIDQQVADPAVRRGR